MSQQQAYINRCSSSDYIKLKRQRVIYNEVPINEKTFGTTNPVKKNGYLYNRNFAFFASLNKPAPNCACCCLKYARNYALLSDYTNGRIYQNWLCNRENTCNQPIDWLFNKPDVNMGVNCITCATV
jgi:hypothetical protein